MDTTGQIKYNLIIMQDEQIINDGSPCSKEQLYGNVVENTPLCIKVFNEKGKLIFINKGGREEHFIKDADDISKWDWVASVKPQYQKAVKTAFENAFSGESSEVEMEHTPEGATHQWCRGVISPVTDSEGKIKSVLFYSIDITALKKTELALRDSEQRYRDLIENTPMCIKVFDKDRKMIFLNKGGRAEHHIKDTDDISKWDWVGTVKKEYQAEAIEKFKNAFATGESSSLEFEHTPEGSTHEWCSSLISPIKDKDGKISSVLFLSNDVSSLKKAEVAAKDAQKLSENIIETANVLVVGLDLVGNINVFNNKAQEVTGYTKEEAIGKSWFEIITPKAEFPEVWKLFNNFLNSGKITHSFENFIATKPGGRRFVSWQNSIVTMQNKTLGTISFGIDITDKVSAEKNLKEKSAELERINEAMIDRELRMVELKKQIKELGG